MKLGKCNCGRDARYVTGTDWAEGSCNKHKVCPTYSQIETELAQYKTDMRKLLVAAKDVISFREGTESYKKAEEIIVNFLER